MPADTPSIESFFRHRRSDLSEPEGDSREMIPGRVLGDYRLKRKLGEGGMGQVWEAQQLSLDRAVALKLLPSDWLLSEARLAMFEREAQAGGRLHHGSIVSVLAYGEVDGLPYIAQELVGDGWTLKDVIQEARLAEEIPSDWYSRIGSFFVQAAHALQVAHEAGVVHRDLKPGNILVAEDDRPMIADFGLAKVSGVETIQRTGDVVGTYCYMSPEQALAKRIGVDHLTDVFSLGVTLYEALTMQRPFDGDTQHQVTEAICWEEPPNPRAIRSKVPRDLAVICLHAMEKRRQDRYGTMGEMAADIERYLMNEPILARPAGPVARARKWSLRHPTATVAVVLFLLAASALALQFVHINRKNVKLQELNEKLEVSELEAQSERDESARQREIALRAVAMRDSDWENNWMGRLQEMASELPEGPSANFLRQQLEAAQNTLKIHVENEISKAWEFMASSDVLASEEARRWFSLARKYAVRGSPQQLRADAGLADVLYKEVETAPAENTGNVGPALEAVQAYEIIRDKPHDAQRSLDGMWVRPWSLYQLVDLNLRLSDYYRRKAASKNALTTFKLSREKYLRMAKASLQDLIETYPDAKNAAGGSLVESAWALGPKYGFNIR